MAAKKKTVTKTPTKASKSKEKRTKISQADVPSYSLEKALKIPQAIADQYACNPVSPLQLAKALNVLPTTGPFRMLCGAASGHGLTEGGYASSEIRLTPLARRIMKPTEEGDDFAAKKEAFLKPKIVNEFISKYDENPLPNDEIAKNVLETMGVPHDRVNDVLTMILEGADYLGMITNLKGKRYIETNGALDRIPFSTENSTANDNDGTDQDGAVVFDFPEKRGVSDTGVRHDGSQNNLLRRVFITHGKNKVFVEPIRQLLKFGELEAVVSVENQSVSKPVPDKVLEDMRSCGAAIIHVDAEERLMNQEGKERVKLNDNVLIEIGAAMALYGRRYILLVKDGVSLPSNLQGLYEVRYSGEQLDGDATIKLMQAINAMKDEKSLSKE